MRFTGKELCVCVCVKAGNFAVLTHVDGAVVDTEHVSSGCAGAPAYHALTSSRCESRVLRGNVVYRWRCNWTRGVFRHGAQVFRPPTR